MATALYRLKNDGVLLRFPDGWDLASSYPDNLKARLEKDAKPPKTGQKMTAKRRKPTTNASAGTTGPRPIILRGKDGRMIHVPTDDTNEKAG